jgi:hypothetical protein
MMSNACQGRFDGASQIRPLDVACRKIDGDVKRLVSLRLRDAAPVGRVPAGLVENEVGNLMNETRLFRDANELVGRDVPVDGMFPSNQGLHPHVLSPGNGVDRLESQVELVVRKCLANPMLVAQGMQFLGDRTDRGGQQPGGNLPYRDEENAPGHPLNRLLRDIAGNELGCQRSRQKCGEHTDDQRHDRAEPRRSE